MNAITSEAITSEAITSEVITTESMNVTNTDLIYNNYKYSIEVLEQNIVKNRLDSKILVNTQKLTPEFCAKYIYYGNIEGGGEETYTLDVSYILRNQPHITEKELTDLIND